MRTGARGDLPAGLDALRRRFERWPERHTWHSQESRGATPTVVLLDRASALMVGLALVVSLGWPC